MDPARHPKRFGLAAFKGVALSGLLTLVVVGGLHPTAPSTRSGVTAEADAYERVVERAAVDRRCSSAGPRDRVMPASALIRTPHGQLRRVSFEVGWDVYNGQRPGQLVAVCPDGTGGIEPARLGN